MDLNPYIPRFESRYLFIIIFFICLCFLCHYYYSANSTLLSLLRFSYFITPYDAQGSSAFSALICIGLSHDCYMSRSQYVRLVLVNRLGGNSIVRLAVRLEVYRRPKATTTYMFFILIYMFMLYSISSIQDEIGQCRTFVLKYVFNQV